MQDSMKLKVNWAVGLALVTLVVGSASAVMAPPLTRSGLAPLVAGPDAREAITRVAFAEAGNQGDSGLAAVVRYLPRQ